jgi:hypothetical protein
VGAREGGAFVTVGRGAVVAGAASVLLALLGGCDGATAAPALAPLTTPTRTSSSPARATVRPAPSTAVDRVPPGAGTRPGARVTQSPGPSPTLRPMTSGESQYRYGCQQGYIMQGCDRYTDSALRHNGIDPNS